MITRDDWISTLIDNAIKTLDHTLYNRMYGSIQKIKEWILSDSKARLVVDKNLPEWFDDFWGMMPADPKQAAKVARSWSAVLELVQDCNLQRSAEYLRNKKEERLYLYELSPNRDLLGQYYQVMAKFQFPEFVEHWVALAGSTLSIPLHHREVAMDALKNLGDYERLQRALTASDASLEQIAETESLSQKRSIQIFREVTCSRFR